MCQHISVRLVVVGLNCKWQSFPTQNSDEGDNLLTTNNRLSAEWQSDEKMRRRLEEGKVKSSVFHKFNSRLLLSLENIQSFCCSSATPCFVLFLSFLISMAKQKRNSQLFPSPSSLSESVCWEILLERASLENSFEFCE